MEISSAIKAQNLVALDTKSPVISLKLGQVLNATVTAKLGGNLIELLANNQKIQAHTDRSIATGQQLKLKVESLNDPILLKAVEAKTTPQQNQLAALQNSRSDLLKTTLPKNPNFEPLVKTLNTVLNAPNLKASLPTQVTQQLQNLMQTLAGPSQLSNKEGLKQALKQSGLFLESHLANIANGPKVSSQQSTLVQNDLKANLLKLLSLLKESTGNEKPQNTQVQANQTNTNATPTAVTKPISTTVPETQNAKQAEQQSALQNTKAAQNNNNQVVELPKFFDKVETIKFIEQALSKIIIQQNNAVVLDKVELPIWNTSIPVLDKKHIDHLDLTVYQETKSSDAEEQSLWSVELTLEMTGLGKLYAKLSLFNGELNTSLWADQAETLDLVEQHLEGLEKQLSKAGLKVNSLTTLHNKPEFQPQSIQANKLIDLHL